MNSKVKMICPYSNKIIAIFHNSKLKDVAREVNMELVNGEIVTIEYDGLLPKAKKGDRTIRCTCGAIHDKPYKPIMEEVAQDDDR